MIDELMSKLGRSRGTASRNPKETARETAVDRLIELASDDPSSGKRGAGDDLLEGRLDPHLAIEESREAEASQDPHALARALTQLKAIVPFLTRLAPLLDARFLPLLELLGMGHGQQNQQQNLAATRELREGVTGLQSGQRDLRLTLQSQAVEIQRLEDQVSRLREAAEKTNLEHSELVEDVKSLGSLVRTVGAALAVLLVILILMVGLLLAKLHDPASQG
ncbi:hypothetical protein [Silvibacterium dinghuense]|uniref:Uncharacterized protein n=1 Tax=Silvibacterium dinghuense TaxID=1560006 RepID=A0A4Q1SID4_9BACT|nr:hypothetical protein [Silvibacterium dinghuense]RXS97361.1 hypothetical protein ESZ00_05495 [Silvibacterium dinghuense]GGG98363.1 hypothetical protein GCM10011586_12180 [Silvibacterium dinghuense]